VRVGDVRGTRNAKSELEKKSEKKPTACHRPEQRGEKEEVSAEQNFTRRPPEGKGEKSKKSPHPHTYLFFHAPESKKNRKANEDHRHLTGGPTTEECATCLRDTLLLCQQGTKKRAHRRTVHCRSKEKRTESKKKTKKGPGGIRDRFMLAASEKETNRPESPSSSTENKKLVSRRGEGGYRRGDFSAQGLKEKDFPAELREERIRKKARKRRRLPSCLRELDKKKKGQERRPLETDRDRRPTPSKKEA